DDSCLLLIESSDRFQSPRLYPACEDTVGFGA
ncbi:MAG: hypothetical protein QOC85_1819, partial [Streptomyces sp.]|nr:hypothetical protein [Streptomyces sp.]